ncbi:MAG: SusC/RagA family TonB-linked outer membrane protein [Maribacter sp.]|nr:MAG: SusC/RagA family TonB-linked outer membrane protein [Maribacter sp.]
MKSEREHSIFGVSKFDLKIRLTVVFLLLCLFRINASTYSQKAKISLDVENTSIESILFDKIEKDTDFKFFYENTSLDLGKKITFKVKNKRITDILDYLFIDTNISYEIDGKQIILTRNSIGPIKKTKTEPVPILPELVEQNLVQGRVTDNDGQPLPGANIVEKGTTNGTQTDFDGNFSLEVTDGNATLIVSYIGFATKELRINGQTNVTIALQESTAGLDEVVLIGYGTARKGDITSSISQVDGIETITSRPVATFTDFLQGNVAGVTVLQQGGDPTASGQIVIRGYGSISDESPLTVVDGVPYYGPAINPQDIASVSVLKDAAAAAIYGAQAASGVIVIQTKKGRKGKPQISLDLYGGIQNATGLPTPLTAEQQASVYNLAADNGGTARQSAHDALQNPWGQTTRTNWMDEIFRSAALVNTNVNISGAGENINYMTSFGYNNKEGVLVGTKSDRYSFRLKSDLNLSDKVTIGENVYYSRTEAVGTNTSSGYSGTILNAVYFPSAAPVRDENGLFHGVVPFDLSQFAGTYGDVYNPVALLLRPTTTSPTNFINAQVYLDYKILKGLTFKTSYAYSTSHNEFKTFVPRIPELGRTNLTNSLTQRNSTTNRRVWDNQFTYTKSFGNHNLDVTAIYSSQFTDFESLSQRAEGFSSEEPFNQYLSNASDQKEPVTSVYEDALTSAIGRVTYDYDNKYFATASIRRDETSRLARDNQADIFPAVSVGWRISDENFFNVEKINDLKFRASWGQIGNINSVGYYSFDVPLGSQTLIVGEDGLRNDRGVYARQQSNPDLIWETSESIDVGLDLMAFDNKFSLTFDYFQKTTRDMILEGLEDKHQGTDAAFVNGGEVKNVGVEISAAFSDKIGDLNYTIRANASRLDNNLENLDGYNNSGIDFINHDGYHVRDALRPYRSTVGQELFSHFLVPYLGIFQSQAEIDAYVKDGNLIQPDAVPGDFKFKDTDGDGDIDNDDRQFHGSYQPDVTYNFNLSANYKGIDMSLIFQGVAGVKAFNAYKYATYNASLQGYNLDNRVLDAWTPSNTNTDIPRISTQDNNNNFGTQSTWYLEDASYLRLKNITLGYSFPKEIMGGWLNGSSLRIYLSAENLFTITDYTGIDPEVGGIGLDVAKYPLSRTISAGLSLKL